MVYVDIYERHRETHQVDENYVLSLVPESGARNAQVFPDLCVKYLT